MKGDSKSLESIRYASAAQAHPMNPGTPKKSANVVNHLGWHIAEVLVN